MMVKDRVGGVIPAPAFSVNAAPEKDFGPRYSRTGPNPGDTRDRIMDRRWRPNVLRGESPNCTDARQSYVDKILKGTKPAELPVEQPTKFDFIINLKSGEADRDHDSAQCTWLGPTESSNSREHRARSYERHNASEKFMRKRFFGLALSALLFALCVSVEAQQPKKIPRIGYVSGADDLNDPGPEKAFRQGLRDLGYIEDKNILIEYRSQEGKADRGPGLVAELVQLKVDVLVLVTSPAIRAAKQATKTIPIVMVTTADPVATGLVDSLARPGGNITGLTRITRDLNGKRLELLKEVVPTTQRVGVLFQAGSTSGDIHFKEYETAARALKIELQSLGVRGQNPDFEAVFQTAAKGRVSALITITNSLTNFYRKKIADLAIKHRLPSMYERTANVEAGGLLSYSANETDSFRRAAVYVDKILKGTKPADLPVEQPTKFEFVINLKTAKALNLTIPQSVLFRADRVIK